MADSRSRGTSSRSSEGSGNGASSGKGSKFIRLTGLWRHTNNGKTYLTGRLGGATVFVFPAEKRKDTDPDYSLSIAPEMKQRGPRPGEEPL